MGNFLNEIRRPVNIPILRQFLYSTLIFTVGKGIIAISIASIILMIISRQAFGFGVWYLYIKYNL